MQLPTYRRITSEDLADAPKGAWKEKLLYAINLFFQQIYSGLSNNLTPEQNDLAQVKTFALTGSATPANNTAKFSTTQTYFPSRVALGAVIVTDSSNPVFAAAPYLSWTWANGTFFVLGICGLTDGVQYQITIEIRWAPVVN